MKPKPFNRRKRFLIELSRIQMLLSVVGALFILVWIFILGVIVGRGYVSDTITKTFNEQIQKLQQEKKALMEKYLAQEKKPELSQDQIVKPNNLDFYDELPQHEKGGVQLKTPQATAKPPEPLAKLDADTKSPSVEPPKTPLKEPVKPSPKEPAKEVPKEPVKPAAKETSAVPPAKPAKESKEPSKEVKEAPKKGGHFMVQVGSYREEATAQSSIKRLQEKKYQALLKAKDIPQKGGKWYRVQVGPYESRAEAEQMVKKLEHDGFQAVLIGND
jgi:cell division protein FtsN